MDYFFRFPGGCDRAVTLSYDDGVNQDEQIIALLKRHGMKGTFNINSGLFHPENTPYDPNAIAHRLPESKIRAVYLNETAEVAVHGLRHMWPACFPKGAAAYEIVADRKKLEEITGSLVTGGAYAYGSDNEETLRALDACGIEYCRTTKSTRNFLLPENWLTWHPTCKHTDPGLMDLTEQFLSMRVTATPQLFMLWGHGYEFDRDNNWHILEQFADRMAGHDNIWYATNGEICRYVNAQRALRASADGSMIYNPSAISVFLSYNRNTVEIHPGETVRLW